MLRLYGLDQNPYVERTIEFAFSRVIKEGYYGAFIKARNHLRDQEGYLIPTTGEAHRYVSDQFDLSPDPVRQLLAEDLVKLRLYRRQADYVDTFPGLFGITQIALRLSEEVISTLNNL